MRFIWKGIDRGLGQGSGNFLFLGAGTPCVAPSLFLFAISNRVVHACQQVSWRCKSVCCSPQASCHSWQRPRTLLHPRPTPTSKRNINNNNNTIAAACTRSPIHNVACVASARALSLIMTFSIQLTGMSVERQLFTTFTTLSSVIMAQVQRTALQVPTSARAHTQCLATTHSKAMY